MNDRVAVVGGGDDGLLVEKGGSWVMVGTRLKGGQKGSGVMAGDKLEGWLKKENTNKIESGESLFKADYKYRANIKEQLPVIIN